MRGHTLLLFIVLFFVACKTTRQSPAPSSGSSSVAITPAGGSEHLFAAKWVLEQINGRAVAASSGEQPYLLFYPGQVSRVNGSTGCNTLRGTFELSAGNGIRFSPLATTKKACVGGSTAEQSFLSALQQVTQFSATETELLLLQDGRTVLKLKAQKSETGQTNPSPANNDERLRSLNAKLLSGVDFLASGNEPFWLLEMGREKGIFFRLMGGDSLRAPMVRPTRLMDVAASSYRLNTAKGLLNVIVYDKPCVNSMSGDTAQNTVEVYWNNKRYAGCGNYLADYRLQDIWVLKAINDSAVDGSKLSRGAPTLELNLRDKTVSGHTGCNGFGGTLEVKGRVLSFRRLIGTMMACDDNGFERRYYQLLSENEMPYEVENGRLTVTSGNAKLRYQKTN